ncbi:MAG TPA: hypothetical protein VFT45_27075 [Longimicrobium sp.]|nr:hypothetical protein [Longimicrobium sp.]
MSGAACECLELGPSSYDEASVGVDTSRGRFGDVSLRTCRACGRRWLRYHVEYEAFTASGRWFLGLLPDDADAGLAPAEAVALLQALPWHVYGGSFFRTRGRRGTGPIDAILL